MADAPPAPWKLHCPWCDWYALVFARGSRGNDDGAGIEAAREGERHAEEVHGRTWQEFLTSERR